MRERFLVPSFLKKFDSWLLKHTPAAWSARTHLVIYYALIVIAIVTLFCLSAFADARRSSHAEVWSGFIGLTAFTGFVIWLIYLLRFNVFKRFGNWHAWEGLKMFVLYFISIGTMLFTVFIPFIVDCAVANHSYNDHELVDDINEINLSVCQLEYNLLPKEFGVDTFELVKRKVTMVERNSADGDEEHMDSVVAMEADDAMADYRPHYNIQTDSLVFYSRLEKEDSTKILTDSIYIVYNCPEYALAGAYFAVNNSPTPVLSSFDIYNRVIKNYRQPDRTALIKRMKQLDEKYSLLHYEESNSLDKTYSVIIEEKYFLREITHSIENIARKKYWWKNGKDEVVRIFFYTSFIITLLLFVFRSSTVKTFFLSLFAGVILLIGTAICVAVFNGDEAAVFIFILLYYALFFLLAGLIKTAAVRTAVQGIALNFTVVITSFIPLTAVGLYFKLLQTYNRENMIVDEGLFQRQSQYLFYAELGGIVIFMLLLEPVFRKLYKRWYALPGE
ncbi:MAG TPA: hypothetical protein PLY34_17230 [Ferruginibacter sp.]|nr:hypothetical protein [Ferruginibacter sp.]